MNEENQVYFIDSDKLPQAALERKHRLEQDPSFRTDHMKYLDDMEIIESDVKDKVLEAMEEYDYNSYTSEDVLRALSKISRHFYRRQPNHTLSRWQGKQRMRQRNILAIRYIYSLLCI